MINPNLLQKFKRMVFISSTDWFDDVSVSYHHFEGILGTKKKLSFPDQADEIPKRVMDIVISSVLGILFLPVCLLTALMIKLDTPGPVIYKQDRLGKDGRRITIFKFRSMFINADKILEDHFVTNAVERQEWDETQKLRKDPRITRVGKWVREFSIDELPQLINVLKGDMSMVGPRPIMLNQRSLYGDRINLYLSVRPGLTGLWQVSGRNRTSFCQRVAYDAYYVLNSSFWLDISILLRTIWVVLSRDGAY